MGLKSWIVVSVLGNRPGRLGRLGADRRLQGPAGYLQLFRQPGGIGAADLPYLGECRALRLVRSGNRPYCLPVLSGLDVSTQPRDQFLVIFSDGPSRSARLRAGSQVMRDRPSGHGREGGSQDFPSSAVRMASSAVMPWAAAESR